MAPIIIATANGWLKGHNILPMLIRKISQKIISTYSLINNIAPPIISLKTLPAKLNMLFL